MGEKAPKLRVFSPGKTLGRWQRRHLVQERRWQRASHARAHLERDLRGWSIISIHNPSIILLLFPSVLLGYAAAPQPRTHTRLPKSCPGRCGIEHLKLLLDGGWDGRTPPAPPSKDQSLSAGCRGVPLAASVSPLCFGRLLLAAASREGRTALKHRVPCSWSDRLPSI